MKPEIQPIAQDQRFPIRASAAELDISRRRSIADPKAMAEALKLARQTRQMVISQVWPGVSSQVSCEVEDLVKTLQSEASGMLEVMLIETIATAYVRLCQTEQMCAFAIGRSAPRRSQISFWDKSLTHAHRRFLRAVETLARVRKLGRITPSLQVNIATNGGQQVNLATGGGTKDNPHDQ